MKKLFILFAVLCLAAPAMASDWNFYGASKFSTFWNNVDTDNNALAPDDSDSDLLWKQNLHVGIGANVKYNDEISGTFEMDSAFNNRLLYASYNWGGGTLVIGKDYTPAEKLYSSSVYDPIAVTVGGDTFLGDALLLGIGQFYEGRQPQIKVVVGSFQLALLKPGSVELAGIGDTQDITGVGTFSAADTTDVTIPKIEASYQFKSDTFFVDVFAGYQTYEIDNAGSATDYDVNAYVVGLGGGVNLGALYINVGGHMGQNYGDFGIYNPLLFDAAMEVSGNSEKDTDAYGYLAVVGFKASDMLSIEAGYGYVNFEKDLANTQEEEGWQAYLNATITITDGFFIVPEIGMIEADYDVGTAVGTPDPNPNAFYAGAKWQINF